MEAYFVISMIIFLISGSISSSRSDRVKALKDQYFTLSKIPRSSKGDVFKYDHDLSNSQIRNLKKDIEDLN